MTTRAHVNLPVLPVVSGRQGSPSPLQRALDERTAPGALFTHRHGHLKCTACAHGCVLDEGAHGVCGVRFNAGGVLRVPFGYVARRYVRSVETNTVFHVRPGASALTFGMYGCDLSCPYCHNHRISQALRAPEGPEECPVDITADALVGEALASGCQVLCSAYNEPMITAEWAYAVFARAKQRGLVTVLVSDGNSTPEALRFMRPVTDVFRVDLKASSEQQYRQLGGRLAPVLESIATAKQLGYWVEVVTLVVPGLNADLPSLSELASRLAAIDREIPWHVNAFVPRYRYVDRVGPDPLFLLSVAGSAYARGLLFVYVSNSLDVQELSHTRCPSCHGVVVARHDYRTSSSTLKDGRCPDCETRLPGLWGSV
jgi:pyruvate formate lyase activating enzyme